MSDQTREQARLGQTPYDATQLSWLHDICDRLIELERRR